MDSRRRTFSRALAASVVVHAGLAMIAVMLLSVRSGRVATHTPPLNLHLIYFSEPGPAGGGGGAPAPASRRLIEVPRHLEPAAVPVAPTVVTMVPPPMPRLDAPVETDAARALQFSGTNLTALGAPGGDGRGPGAGPGDGPGLGPGINGGAGGGPRRAGGEITAPALLRSVQPQFTSAALLAKIQGRVELEAVVLADGTVGEVRVTRSLDQRYGLDSEAIRAAKQWLFRPGTRAGRPVDVLVTLILDFSLH
jgi:protein TonB